MARTGQIPGGRQAFISGSPSRGHVFLARHPAGELIAPAVRIPNAYKVSEGNANVDLIMINST